MGKETTLNDTVVHHSQYQRVAHARDLVCESRISTLLINEATRRVLHVPFLQGKEHIVHVLDEIRASLLPRSVRLLYVFGARGPRKIVGGVIEAERGFVPSRR